MIPASRRGLVAAAVAFVALTTLFTPLRRELYVGDETKYSQVVREMRDGHFFVPTLGGTPFTHKPPVHFWLIDALTYPFGVYSIWPFVLPSLVAFGLLLWLMWRMEGPLAAFICGTSLMVWASAQTARMDVSFTALVALAAFLLFRFFDRDDSGGWASRQHAETRSSNTLLVGAAAILGLALIIKGPMAPVIGVTLFLFEWIRRRRAPRGNYFLAIVTLLAIPLLWLVPTILVAGEAYWNEVFYKQTVGRAVGAWVHKSPPWFYLAHAPADLAPWFLLLVVALVVAYKRRDATAKFYVSWILAVLVPYSFLSSKLDVYMMAMIPPVALTIARYLREEDRFAVWGVRVNRVMLVLFAIIGAAGLFLRPEHIKGPDGALAGMMIVKALFAVMLAGSLVGLIVTRRLIATTVAVGLVPIVTFAYIAIALVPLANEMASTRPLIRALQKQQVPADSIALHASPHLWIRDMPREFEHARQVDPQDLATWSPEVIVTARKKSDAIATKLRGYRKVDEFRMIGKWFDVYRR